MMTLFFCLAIGMVLASILKLVSAKYTMTVRSTDWNQAIPVLEAGVEEAMTHIQDDSSPSANGWTASTLNGVTVYRKQRSFTDGSYFYATIYGASSNTPTIISQGYVRSPLKASEYIARTVKVQTAKGTSLFSKAILTRGTINFAGDMQVNSYDSSNPNYSNPNGTYNASKTLANGWIGSMASSGTAIDLAGALIYGGIQYNAGATYNLGSGIVGDTAYVNNSGNSGTIEAGYKDNTLNVAISTTPPAE
jgi:hypothetical protein